MTASAADVQNTMGSRQRAQILQVLPWMLVLVGVCAMYVPTFADLFSGVWQSNRNDYGPVVLAAATWFAWFRFRQLLTNGSVQHLPAPWPGITLLAAGACCYSIGRSQGLVLLEVGSLIPVLAGIVATCFGTKILARLWFAFFLMLFMVPLPASFVEAITQPMKLAVSFASEWCLARFDYPVVRDGVVLTIGHHRLLVADACAGLRSLFTLEALGLLYLNLVRHPSMLRSCLLACAIAPISFFANTLRVVSLALTTYHYGYDAGQGYLHGMAGIILFSTALLLIIGLDGIFCTFLPDKASSSPMPPRAAPIDGSKGAFTPMTTVVARLGIRASSALLLLLPMLLSSATASMLAPTVGPVNTTVRLPTIVPEQFGNWRVIETPAPDPQLLMNGATGDAALYDQIVMRVYANGHGEKIMLALAYSRDQRQDIKIHRPAPCYIAQGFEILDQRTANFSISSRTQLIAGEQLLVTNRRRIEAVSDWIRIGDEYPRTAWDMRMKILRDGLGGKVPDGILVRVSSLIDAPSGAMTAYALQKSFITELMNAVPQSLLGVFVATPPTAHG